MTPDFKISGGLFESCLHHTPQNRQLHHFAQEITLKHQIKGCHQTSLCQIL